MENHGTEADVVVIPNTNKKLKPQTNKEKYKRLEVALEALMRERSNILSELYKYHLLGAVVNDVGISQ